MRFNIGSIKVNGLVSLLQGLIIYVAGLNPDIIAGLVGKQHESLARGIVVLAGCLMTGLKLEKKDDAPVVV